MQYGLCCLSHVPMRRTVSDASEMLTELLFGDLVTVVDSYRQWVKVENRMDGYEGWVDSKQLMPLSKEEFDEHAADTSRFFTSDFLCALECQQEGSLLRVGMGCRLPFYRPDSRTFRMGQRLFVCHGEVMRSPESFVMGMDAMMERAVTLLKTQGENYNITFVGDGDMRQALESEVCKSQLESTTWFYGACYDEKTNADLIYNADLCIAPGNIGLTAMHSLMFGCPAISHNDFKMQMPEFEAIIPGQTGDFFEYGNLSDLARCISLWFATKSNSREKVRQACYEEIDKYWNPYYQLDLLKKLFD